MTGMLSRRAFVSASGALVVTLATADWPPAATSDPAPAPALEPDRLGSYIAIDKDGTVTAYYGKIDGGQGLDTAIAQMVAEELDVALERVHVVMGDMSRTVNMGGASAATGVSRAGMNLRRMAAEARRLLIDMAARRLSVAAERLTVSDGVIHETAGADKRISYAELIGGRGFDAPVTWNRQLGNGLAVTGQAAIKAAKDFKVIGRSPPRRDLPPKVFGTLQMAPDVRLPGMLHARMLRPKVAGAVPVKVDAESIKDIPGAKVVWIKDLLAVVAEKEWNAVRAARTLAVTWSESKPGFPGHDKLYDHIRKAPIVKRHIQQENGNFDEGIKQAVRIVEGEYEFPTHSHSSMGPACAVADFRDGECTLYTSTQKPHYAALGVAELLGLPPEKVRAVWMYGTGSYGRNDQGDATADAAVLSRHLGRPVRVQYMRDEGIAWDPKGTASVNRSKAGLDAAEAVRIAAERYGWEQRPSPRRDQGGAEAAIGRGIAYRRHFTTFIALIAEVKVVRKTGVIEPLRYLCAHDVGLIVNPDTLRQVIDRQLVYGTSRTMFEEVRFDENRVISVDWQTYPVLRADFPLPRIDIVLIDRPEEAPSGAAEMALGLVPAAIGNAVFDATGVRLRRVPFTPERVKAALG
jgi:CO/xanthine dehydrogenase Mo-binding subunit